jgi:hypothetical protein
MLMRLSLTIIYKFKFKDNKLVYFQTFPGVSLSAVSYNGNLQIMAGVDESILPASFPSRTLVDRMAQELDVLKQRLSV